MEKRKYRIVKKYERESGSAIVRHYYVVQFFHKWTTGRIFKEKHSKWKTYCADIGEVMSGGRKFTNLKRAKKYLNALRAPVLKDEVVYKN